MKLSYQIAIDRLLADSADKKVLELLSAIKGFQISELTSLSAKQLLTIAEHLDITEASVRMALSRQTKQGKLIRENGKYALAKNRNPFVLPRFWLDMNGRCTDWNGDWLLINQQELKFNPTIMRRLNNTTHLLGYRFFQSLGWVRPNNLIDLREETLFHFQAVTGQFSFLTGNLNELNEESLNVFVQRWPIQQLNQFYRDAYDIVCNECDLVESSANRDILMRSFAIGRLLVEHLCSDPWLPAEIIDASARGKLVAQTIAYYQKIMPAWLSVMEPS